MKTGAAKIRHSAIKTPARVPSRLSAIDLQRGFLMVLMALDHAAWYSSGEYPSDELWGGSFPVHATLLSFLTKNLPHLCAPGFLFLMGAGLVLFSDARKKMGWSSSRIVRTCLLRGVIFVTLQLTLENYAWSFGPYHAPDSSMLYFGVFYTLGVSMMLGGWMVQLPTKILTALTVLGFALYPLFIPDPSLFREPVSVVSRLLLIAGASNGVEVYFPAFPWLFVTALGILFGRFVQKRKDEALQWTGVLGATLLVLFLAFRLFGGNYGNLRPTEGLFSVVKYPPSLAYLTGTLGINLCLLNFFTLYAKIPFLQVFGRTSLFFYVVHLYALSAIYRLFLPADGIGLPKSYLVWASVIVLLYPLCQAYDRFKRKRGVDSFWHLL